MLLICSRFYSYHHCMWTKAFLSQTHPLLVLAMIVKVISEPTLLVLRMDYANLAFTVADVYNAWTASNVWKIKQRPQILFIDGHSKVTHPSPPRITTYAILYTFAEQIKKWVILLEYICCFYCSKFLHNLITNRTTP